MSSALETLRRDFGGDIIEPGGAEYESARRTLLASGSPAYVLRPKNVGDVQAGVRFAADAGLLLSVRGGGHGYAGFGTNDGGVVIDLSKLANVEIIDKERHLADGAPLPPGIQFVTRNAFADKESVPEVVQILAEVRTSEQSPFITVRSVGGAVSRVPDDATAYAHRQAELLVVTTTAGPEPAVEAARPALDAIWERLAPHVNGVYANFLASATEKDVAAIYPAPTHQRLLTGNQMVSYCRLRGTGLQGAVRQDATRAARRVVPPRWSDAQRVGEPV